MGEIIGMQIEKKLINNKCVIWNSIIPIWRMLLISKNCINIIQIDFVKFKLVKLNWNTINCWWCYQSLRFSDDIIFSNFIISFISQKEFWIKIRSKSELKDKSSQSSNVMHHPEQVTNDTRPTFTLNLRILTRGLEKSRRKKNETWSNWLRKRGEQGLLGIFGAEKEFLRDGVTPNSFRGWWRRGGGGMISCLRSFRGWDRNYEWVLRCFQRFKRVRIFLLFVYCVLYWCWQLIF